MKGISQYLIVGLIVSLFYFSFGFTFLPPNVNTKMLLAILGLFIVAYDTIRNRMLAISRPLLGAIGFALVFSVLSFFAVDYNDTNDLSYATYFISFSVWIFSAYTVCTVIKWTHGDVNIILITYYLAGVCVVQCFLALAIDFIPAFQFFVDGYIDQGQEFLLEVDRLYGIGASLDNAGVRFSIVLILIAGVLSREESLRKSRRISVLLLASFFIIIVIGNILSRTTSVGAVMAFIYFLWNTRFLRKEIDANTFRFTRVFMIILGITILIIFYFYRTDEVFYRYIRFAFEGFFNWVEIGEWRTDSTDKLNSTMWVWPTDLKTWIIGTGRFDDWAFGTDIGYCRFILYCGLVGFSAFALFFVYNYAVFAARYKKYSDMFFFFLVLTFLIWVKVSTDIFLIYALLYCMDMLRKEDETLNYQDENSLQYSGNI